MVTVFTVPQEVSVPSICPRMQTGLALAWPSCSCFHVHEVKPRESCLHPSLGNLASSSLSFLGKTALLHALASSDGVQIHNTENIRLLLEGGKVPHLPTAMPAALIPTVW